MNVSNAAVNNEIKRMEREFGFDQDPLRNEYNRICFILAEQFRNMTPIEIDDSVACLRAQQEAYFQMHTWVTQKHQECLDINMRFPSR